MEGTDRELSGDGEGNGQRSRWWCVVGAGCLAVALLGILLPRGDHSKNGQSASTDQPAANARGSSGSSSSERAHLRHTHSGPTASAEEIVATKLSQFGRNRRDVMRGMAKRFNVEVRPDVERFFDAVERGKWDEIQAAFQPMFEQKKTGTRDDLNNIWGPILEAYGVAEATHLWPAQKLLDYGNSILDSLRPGMIYVGGTDPGRFIPTFLNETSDGEHHIILTQNAMADNTYLKYVDFLYANNFGTLNESDSQSAFQQYIADAQKRLQHDQEFPNEPKQLLPGEDVRITDGRIEVSGQVAVMGINELLLQDFMKKNPGASFALEESFPMKSFYSDSIPLGPIMELRAADAQSTFTSERADQVLDYWRDVAQQLTSDADSPQGSESRKTYSKMVSSQAHLLEDHNFTADAEQAYRLAAHLEPSSPEAVYGLANLLARGGHTAEAQQIITDFQRRNPEQTWANSFEFRAGK
jgi:Putative Zn-dependent protease, contains TPR repeats